MIKDTVELFLEKYKLLKPKNNIIVAFSGGFDSMCLLHIMISLAKKYKLNVIAIHLNHGWRGKESDAEEIVCKNFASEITFYSEKLPKSIPHTETAAREARYEFFEKCAEKFKSKVVLTAHNANDNAETIYYRLMKGTGITGLEGIQEHRDIYYRPLLQIYRNEIENYCKKHNLKPNNDSSNSNNEYMRNKIRNEIFPLLKKDFPNIEKNLNSLAGSAKAVNKIINDQILPLEKYSTKEFIKLDENIRSTVVHRFLRDENLDYDKNKINNLLDFIVENKNSKSGKTVSLTKDLWLFVNSKEIKKIDKKNPDNFEIEIKKEGTYKINDLIFKISKTNKIPQKYPKDTDYTAYTELSKINFVLRNRLDGDIIQPFGMSGRQKLKKYLNCKKIPKHERNNLPFLCQNNEILWAPGIGISDKIKVKTKPTHILKIKRG